MNAALEALLTKWRESLDDGVAKVIIDMARELGVPSPIVSLDELRAQAAKAQPSHDRSHHVLGRMLRSQYDGFVKGRVALVDPTLLPEGNGYRSNTFSVWDPNSARERHFRPEVIDVFVMQQYLEEQIVPPQPMKVELRKFVANQKFSEETLMFRAEIYANGEHIGSASNDGRGGACNVHYTNPMLGALVTEYILHLPPEKYTIGREDFDGNDLGDEQGASYYLGEDGFYSKLATDMLMAKDNARIAKKLAKDADAYRARGLKPFKFTMHTGGQESFIVIGLKSPADEPTARAQLTKKYKPTTIVSEAM